MNRLKTNINGGFPFDLDDIRWDQDAVRDALKGLGGAFGGMDLTDGYVLSGCEILAGVAAPGYVFMAGEVWKFDGGPVPPSLGYLYWIPTTTYDPAGTETFEDSSSNDTYEIRKVVIDTSPVPLPLTLVTDCPTIFDRIESGLGAKPWKSFSEAVQGVGASATGTATMRYKRIGKTVHYQCSGTANFGGGIGGGIRFPVPTEIDTNLGNWNFAQRTIGPALQNLMARIDSGYFIIDPAGASDPWTGSCTFVSSGTFELP